MSEKASWNDRLRDLRSEAEALRRELAELAALVKATGGNQ